MDFKKINIEKAKKISSWLILGFLLSILVFVLFPLLPIENNYSLKMVLSGSMEPAIKTGGIVMVKPASEYHIGDVVTYKYGRRDRDLTTHRIIGQQDDEFITKGDNNNAADIYPIKKEQILGKVLLTIPYAGYAANFAHSKFGLLLLILIPALLIIGSESLKIFKEIKRMRQKNDRTKDNIKAKISIFLILFFVFSLFSFINTTNAYFSDSVILENNHFQAGFWVPVLNPIGDKSGIEGELLQFTVSATDPNGDPLIYSASNLPSGATFNGQTFSWTPTPGQAGTYSNVHFEVSDGKYTDFENITITVTEMPPPEITDVNAINITQNSADITWKTNQPATSKVEYGTTTSYGLFLEDSTPLLSHTISISSLVPNTLYHYRVSSKNSAGKEATSVDYHFTTSEE